VNIFKSLFKPNKLCGSCKHWQPEDIKQNGAIEGAGECLKIPQIWDVTNDIEINDGEGRVRRLKKNHAGILAMVEDGSGYKARFVTMPNFGCVKHQSK
jgi:hypothetical protein